MKKGCPYGTHRVISPKGVLPQPADVIDNTMEIYDNEVLIDVQTLNIDSASFTEIERRSDLLRAMIRSSVRAAELSPAVKSREFPLPELFSRTPLL